MSWRSREIRTLACGIRIPTRYSQMAIRRATSSVTFGTSSGSSTSISTSTPTSNTQSVHFSIPKQRSINPKFERVSGLIRAHKFKNLASEISNRYKHFNTAELVSILRQLHALHKHLIIRKIYRSKREQFIGANTLLGVVMESAFLEKDYELFEEVFTYYLQSTDESSKLARHFNMALVVFLKTNTEFAKQLLYQMVYSHHPMDDKTLYEFLLNATDVSTFSTVRFVFDILKNNPSLPISDSALGQLMIVFIRNGKSKDISELEQYLENIDKLDNHYVRMARFLNRVVSIDPSCLWLEVDEFMQSLKDKTAESVTFFYDRLYLLLRKRATIEDMKHYTSLAQRDGHKDTLTLRVRGLLTVARTGNTHELFEYVELLKSNYQLDKDMFITIWNAFKLNQPGLENVITSKFKGISYSLDVYWKSEALRDLEKESSNSNSLSQMINVTCEQDLELLTRLNNKLRDGKRPTVELFTRVLQQLIKMKSPYASQVYELCTELYTPVPLHLELSWFANTLRYDSHAEAQLKIETFLFEKDQYLRYPHYAELSDYAFKKGLDKVGFELISRATQSKNFRVDKNIISLYVPILKFLAKNGNGEEYIKVVEYILKENYQLNPKYNRLIKNTSCWLLTKCDSEELDYMKPKIDEMNLSVKDRYREQTNEYRKVLDDTIELLSGWR